TPLRVPGAAAQRQQPLRHLLPRERRRPDERPAVLQRDVLWAVPGGNEGLGIGVVREQMRPVRPAVIAPRALQGRRFSSDSRWVTTDSAVGAAEPEGRPRFQRWLATERWRRRRRAQEEMGGGDPPDYSGTLAAAGG